MPTDIVGLVIDRSEYKEQLKLRKVSKSLRSFVDNHKPECKSIEILCCDRFVSIEFDNHSVIYTSHVHDKYRNLFKSIVERDDFIKVAFDDLVSTFKNPRLQLELFSFAEDFCEEEEQKEYYNEIRNVLESLNHQVSVKNVELCAPSPSSLLLFLPYLKPDILENISLQINDERGRINWRMDPIVMDQVALLKQWKQAEELELQYGFDGFPMEYATHFKRFLIAENFIYEPKFIRIRDYLSQLDNFEHCILSCFPFRYNRHLVYQFLGTPVSSNTTEEVFHYRIPDSDYYFELKKAKDSLDVDIVKKKREDNR